MNNYSPKLFGNYFKGWGDNIKERVISHQLRVSHKSLLAIAKVASIFSWIIFVFFILSAINYYYQAKTVYFIKFAGSIPTNSFEQMLTNDFTYAIKLFLNMIKELLHGGFYFLVLKGISCGLRMIVQTDINYKTKAICNERESSNDL
ncbi:MAG: hypothetical protein ABFD02_02720 [Bacteroidales bacterium]